MVVVVFKANGLDGETKQTDKMVDRVIGGQLQHHVENFSYSLSQ